jgi:tRNA 2-thiouridine synthesizing protein A
MATKQLDAKGLMCPLPVLKARRAMKDMAPGDVLEIEATDPGSVKDFEHFCEATGNRLLESSAIDGIFSYRIEKAG